MSDRTLPTLPKWPFLLGDALLLVAATLIFLQAHRPMTPWEIGGFGVCVALGAWLAIVPFRAAYQAELQLQDQAALADTLAQIQNLEAVAGRIATASSQWQAIQDLSAQTVGSAKEVNDRLMVQGREFLQFLEKANDMEKTHLRLEADKAHRAEQEWLQIAVRLLDHVFALHGAGVRSGQPGLIAQLTNFQHACRDIVRRVGLLAFAAEPNAPFDPTLHQSADASQEPPAGTPIAETIAAGYSFQGQLLRRAIVNLATPVASPVPTASPAPAHAEAEAEAETTAAAAASATSDAPPSEFPEPAVAQAYVEAPAAEAPAMAPAGEAAEATAEPEPGEEDDQRTLGFS